jgi:glyoxylase-like metal-dependent hydrolase (beta-lactamase superfamily II)
MRAFLAFALALATHAATAAYPFNYEHAQVAPGVHVFTERFGHAIVSSNITAIVGRDGMVVVDSGQHPRITRAIAAEIRALSPKPVLYVVNTHWHNDHVAGNYVLAEAFPEARFVAHAFTAETIDREIGPYYGGNCQKFISKQTQALRDALASGIAPDGKPLTDARRERYREILVDADAAIEECAEFRPRGSDLTFRERITLRLGDRDVEVMYLGRANTAGDAVVYVPDAKLVAIGDILVHPFPFAFQSYIGEWAQVLRKVEAMDAAVIVPGHGPVMRDKEYLRTVAGLMESIDRQVRAAYVPGMKLEELKSKVDVREWRQRIAGENAVLGLNFDAMAASAVGRAWQQANGHMEPEGLPAP